MSVVSRWRRDSEGALRLALDGFGQSVALVEASHAAWSRAMNPFLWWRGASDPADGEPFDDGPPGDSPPLAGFAYRGLRRAAELADRAVRAGFALLPPAVDRPGTREQPWNAMARAALNGVLGDRLEAMGNPLALPMTLRYKGRLLLPEDPDLAAALPGVTDHLLILVHGLCMADVFWNYYGHHHGRFLNGAVGVTPVCLSYNTGRHISSNGRELSHLVERLARHWPVPLRRISLIGYSMGGLVVRAALRVARADGADWLRHGAHAVYMGSPHHGAPLERGGHYLQTFAELNPVLAPLGRLARVRSAGITDLRHGSIADEDWAGRDRFHRHAGKARRPAPLDPAFRHHVIAATMGAGPGDALDRALGDGLVPVDSAFGRHPDHAYDFGLAEKDRLLVTRTHHLELLASTPVADRLAHWLAS